MNKQENVDIILGNPHIAIRKLAWPMMISMLLIMTYNLADSIWVSGLGPNALSAIGFITPIFLIIIGLGNGLGAGANSLIARCIGAKDKLSADNASVHSIILTIIISVLSSILFLLILPTLLDLMAAGNVKNSALLYGNIVFSFNILFIFSNVGSAILRSEGDVKRAMYAMLTTSILNIVLDPIFIYYFNLGISGAAWATVLSASITCFVLIYWLWIKKDTYLNVYWGYFDFKWRIIFDELNVAIPSSAEALIFSITGIIVNNFLVIVGGTIAVGTYAASMRLVQMAMIPLMGLGTAVLTVCGAAYGARDVSKIDDTLTYSLRLGCLISLVLMFILYVFAPQLSLIFGYTSSTSVLVSKISSIIQVAFLVIITVNYGLLPSSMFQGLGKGFTSLGLSTFRTFIAETIGAYVFGISLGLGEIGIYYGLVFGASCGAILSYICAKWYIRRLYKVIITK